MVGTDTQSGYVQVLTAAGSIEEADAIAAALLEARLVACVQVVGPVQSRYWWKGQLERSEEWLCLAKTTAGRVDAAMAEIGRRHSYETPEVTVTPIVAGSDRYLGWIAEEVAEVVAEHVDESTEVTEEEAEREVGGSGAGP